MQILHNIVRAKLLRAAREIGGRKFERSSQEDHAGNRCGDPASRIFALGLETMTGAGLSLFIDRSDPLAPKGWIGWAPAAKRQIATRRTAHEIFDPDTASHRLKPC